MLPGLDQNWISSRAALRWPLLLVQLQNGKAYAGVMLSAMALYGRNSVPKLLLAKGL
jgi:hypothetical protein